MDNIALLQRLQELGPLQASHPLLTGSKLREVNDPLSWVSCFLAFMATKTEAKEVRELAAYGQMVLHLAGKHGGKGWMAYDKLFRQQQAAGAAMPWAELNPSLMAATVLGNDGEQGQVCSLCMASDHSTVECALASVEAAGTKPGITRQANTGRSSSRPRSQHPYGNYSPRLNSGYPYPADEPCRRFNRGTCNMAPCKFEHCCNYCPARGPHPATHCPQKGGPRPRQPYTAGTYRQSEAKPPPAAS